MWERKEMIEITRVFFFFFSNEFEVVMVGWRAIYHTLNKVIIIEKKRKGSNILRSAFIVAWQLRDLW